MLQVWHPRDFHRLTGAVTKLPTAESWSKQRKVGLFIHWPTAIGLVHEVIERFDKCSLDKVVTPVVKLCARTVSRSRQMSELVFTRSLGGIAVLTTGWVVQACCKAFS